MKPRIPQIAAIALSVLASQLDAQAVRLPRIAVVTTGGTIASGPGRMLTGDDLVTAVPQLRGVARIEVHEFSRLGSSKMTPSHWLRLSKLVSQLFTTNPDLGGVVVTHGTDSMEETAFFLHLTVHDRRPVVVVGAMRTSDAVSADGPANLLNALRVAASPEATGKGVLVVLNEEINSARDVVKTDANRLHTFRAVELGVLGFADPDRVTFYRSPSRPHTSDSEFDITSIDSLPAVSIVTDYAGSDGSDLVSAADRGARGLVLTAFPSGELSEGTGKAVLAIAGRGIPVVIHSRALTGRTRESYVRGVLGAQGDSMKTLAEKGIIVGGDFSSHKARILLMLALTRARAGAAIQRVFDTY